MFALLFVVSNNQKQLMYVNICLYQNKFYILYLNKTLFVYFAFNYSKHCNTCLYKQAQLFVCNICKSQNNLKTILYVYLVETCFERYIEICYNLCY